MRERSDRGRRARRGTHRARLTRRGRAALGALLAIAATGAGVGLIAGGGPEEVVPVCARAEDLQTRRGVTLTPEAMEAFKQAEDLAGRRIEVIESYRSCRQQARACESICGNRRGCPGRCAPPGLSWHQRGAAIDITEAMLGTPGVADALEQAGWCQAVPKNDPGHFSFGGCH